MLYIHQRRLHARKSTVSRKSENKKLTKLYWHHKRAHQNDYRTVHVEPTKWKGTGTHKNFLALCAGCVPPLQIRFGAFGYIVPLKL